MWCPRVSFTCLRPRQSTLMMLTGETSVGCADASASSQASRSCDARGEASLSGPSVDLSTRAGRLDARPEVRTEIRGCNGSNRRNQARGRSGASSPLHQRVSLSQGRDDLGCVCPYCHDNLRQCSEHWPPLLPSVLRVDSCSSNESARRSRLVAVGVSPYVGGAETAGGSRRA